MSLPLLGTTWEAQELYSRADNINVQLRLRGKWTWIKAIWYAVIGGTAGSFDHVFSEMICALCKQTFGLHLCFNRFGLVWPHRLKDQCDVTSCLCPQIGSICQELHNPTPRVHLALVSSTGITAECKHRGGTTQSVYQHN